MKKILSNIVAILPYLIVFVASLYSPSDPDLGWHLKYGEYFFTHHQILRDNTFSVMMPDYHWANVSWGTDVISYAAYALGGFLGLTILGALVVTGTFYFFSKAARLTVWDQTFLFPLLLYLEKPLNSVSFRGQQISLLFVGILFYLFSLYEKHPKILYLTIPLFMIWVNLHGEFLLGLALFFLWMVLYVATNARSFVIARKLLLIFILSCLATLVNPFGVGVHLDALAHISNPLLKGVGEYLPFESLSMLWWNQVVVAVFLGLSFLFLYFSDKVKGKIPLFGSALVLYVLSFKVRRYAWPAYYLALPLMQPLPEFLKPDKKRTMLILSAVFSLIILGSVVWMQMPFTKFTDYSWATYCKDGNNNCSPKSAEVLRSYLRDSGPSNSAGRQARMTKLYSLYGWGGWLIWNYPQIKPTIDGRMHLWKDEKGYEAFADYYDYEQNVKDINKSSYDVVYMSPNKPVYDRMLHLVKEKQWKQVYEDEYAGIFVRK